MKTFSESNDKIIYLLGELVALQKISNKSDVETGIMENLSFMKTFSESNDKIIYLLGELVALQKISNKADVETS